MKTSIRILILWVTGFFAPVVFAQNLTTLTGTVIDSDSQVWGGATWTANLNYTGPSRPVYSGGGLVPLSFTGYLTTGGVFQPSANVGNNSQIIPAGTTWTFTVCSATSAPCFVTQSLLVSGASINLGAYLSGVIPAPRITASYLVYAYNATEVVNAVNGYGYVNTILGKQYYYLNGWEAISGASGLTGPYNLTNQVATFLDGSLQAVGNPFSDSIACSASGLFEIGNVSTNPNNCTFGYSNGTVASASLTDGTHNVTLTTPFTSGALPYVYSTNTTFTVHATATDSQTASASDSISFLPREFGGVGTSGATSITASGSSAVLVGATGTLSSAGLGQQSTWGPYSPSNQNIYVAGTSSACTFTSGGFAFPMNSPLTISFTNQYGSIVTMYLYQSTNLLSSPFTLNGTC